MINYKVHLIRTGRTSAQEEKRYVGQSDPPLCEEGRRELRQLRQRYCYPPAEVVFTSPLQRCVETAGLLYPDTYTIEQPGLMDMHLGRFEGHTFAQLRDDPAFSAWLQNSTENPPPGGEEPSVFQERVLCALRDVFAHMLRERVRNAAVVTHGGVIMTLLAAMGLPKMPLHSWATANGCGYTLLLTPQMWMRDGAVEVFAPLPLAPEEGPFDEDEGFEE